MMPQNLEAEQAVLASVLLDTEAAFSILSSLESEDFYSNSHQVIFDAMISLNRENKPVDFTGDCCRADRDGWYVLCVH